MDRVEIRYDLVNNREVPVSIINFDKEEYIILINDRKRMTPFNESMLEDMKQVEMTKENFIEFIKPLRTAIFSHRCLIDYFKLLNIEINRELFLEKLNISLKLRSIPCGMTNNGLYMEFINIFKDELVKYNRYDMVGDLPESALNTLNLSDEDMDIVYYKSGQIEKVKGNVFDVIYKLSLNREFLSYQLCKYKDEDVHFINILNKYNLHETIDSVLTLFTIYSNVDDDRSFLKCLFSKYIDLIFRMKSSYCPRINFDLVSDEIKEVKDEVFIDLMNNNPSMIKRITESDNLFIVQRLFEDEDELMRCMNKLMNSPVNKVRKYIIEKFL